MKAFPEINHQCDIWHFFENVSKSEVKNISESAAMGAVSVQPFAVG